MKVLKKLSLVAAISAAAISAQAEMTSIEDSVMGDITGQAGVTIEMSTSATVGQVLYTDEGSVAINTIAVGGGINAGTKVVEGVMTQTQTIDVDAAGNLVIGSSAGSVGLTIGDISLSNATSAATYAASTKNTLVTNVYLAADLGASTITVRNGTSGLATGAAATNAVTIDMASSIKITDAGATVTLGSGSIGISGVTFDDGAGGNATMSQSIYAQSALANGATDESGATLTAARSAGLVVESGAISGSLTVGAIELGGTSIGSVAVSNINMAGSTMVIYGH